VNQNSFTFCKYDQKNFFILLTQLINKQFFIVDN